MIKKTLTMAVAIGLSLGTGGAAWSSTLDDVMKERGLTQKDLLAAAKTYTPSGGRDEYLAFSSGGQSGQVIVYGIPSMRILKYIGVFTPEPWQGYGFDDESKAVLADGNINGKEIRFGDTHHPAFSETEGEYNGKYLFINDKANPRIAVIDLHDFETKQIVVNPHFNNEHGGAFVTPNTDYIIEAAQYPAPFENEYVPLEQFNDRYRGGVTYWAFDKEKGRIDPAQSFTVELPPYSQDLSDAGKFVSDGWSFTNSFCSERYVGGIERGRPPFEAGCSAKDTDFMHVTNWKKAAELVAAGKVKPKKNPKGRQIFTKKMPCSGCHQYAGRKNKLSGGRSGPSLVEAGVRLNPDWILAYMMQPEAFKPVKMMPVFAGLLSDKDMLNISRHVASFKPKKKK